MNYKTKKKLKQPDWYLKRMFNELFICVGVIIAPHGIKGNVKVKSYTSIAGDIAKYNILYDHSFTNSYQVQNCTSNNNNVTLSFAGITTRNQAEDLVGTKLYIERSKLPILDSEEEFYYVDLIGMKVILPDGEEFGTVKAMHNFGAGDIVEIILDSGGDEYFAFTKQIFPEIRIKEKLIVIMPAETSP